MPNKTKKLMFGIKRKKVHYNSNNPDYSDRTVAYMRIFKVERRRERSTARVLINYFSS